ncbi:MAG: oligoendopeptidase F [candidate division Zixibacteria bacterium]|nr:oligoendopeptidase F [candidate division Zixibacteria bacterium]
MYSKTRSFNSTLIIAILGLALLTSQVILAKPNTLNRDEIPDKYKWDLNDIYPDWETWETGLVQLEKLMDDYAALKGTISQGPQQLLHANKLSDELNILSYKVYRYPALSSVTDTRNNEMSAKVQKVSILFSKFGVATSWFTPELLSIPWETMEKWLNETEELAPYRYGIEDTYRQQKHVLDAEKEELLSYFSQFRGTPSSIYSQLSTSDIKFPEVTLSNGETVTMTSGQYYNTLSTNRNQEDRALAFSEYYGTYHANANTYAAIYNGVLQRDWASAQARKYGSTLEAALEGDNVPLEVYENLVKMVKEGANPAIRYYALRKKLLELEEYHGYDGSIPIVNITKTYDYDEITGWIIESVKPLGKEYQKKIKQIFENRWIDVYENEGKRSGAFSASVYGVHPYMLMNFNETLDNVFTMAHEAGHAMHSMLSNENQPFATSSYTIFVAEVASTLNEALFLDYMLKKTKEPIERAALLQQAIENIMGTFYGQTMFAEFELEAHKMVEQGQPITAKNLSDLYEGIWKDYHGEVVTFDSLYRSTWTRISHFMRSPYYVYKYATCFASSAQIFGDLKSKDKKVRKETLDKYLTLLKSGGNDYPMEQLKKAGVDLTKPETFQAVIDQLDKLVTQLEEEVSKL